MRSSTRTHGVPDRLWQAHAHTPLKRFEFAAWQVLVTFNTAPKVSGWEAGRSVCQRHVSRPSSRALHLQLER